MKDRAHIASGKTGPVSSLLASVAQQFLCPVLFVCNARLHETGPFREEADAVGVINTGFRTNGLGQTSAPPWHEASSKLLSLSFLIFKLEIMEFCED